MNQYLVRGLAGGFAGLVVLAAGPAHAVVPGPTAGESFAFRLNNSANSDGQATGDILVWGVNGVRPAASSYGKTAQCPSDKVCTSYSDPDLVWQSLFHRPWTWRPEQYYATRPWETSQQLLGSWTMPISSAPDFKTGLTLPTTPVVGAAEKMDFVHSMTASGAGVTPTIQWTYSGDGPKVDAVRIRIFDRRHTVTVQSRNPGFAKSFQQSDLIFEHRLAGAETQFTLPAGWSDPQGASHALVFGNPYSIEIALDHLRGDGTIESRSSSFFEFTPINLPGVAKIELPTIAPVPTHEGILAGPVYSFKEVAVSKDSVTYIDPFVATGFTFTTGTGDPNFKSVLVPLSYGDGLYDIKLWNGSEWLSVKVGLGVNESFDFTLNGHAAGVDRFQIVGIEAAAMVSPLDTTGFVTGLTFVEDGTFSGSMQAIVVETAPVPEPETYAMLLAGLGLMGVRLRRQRAAGKGLATQ